MLRILAEGLISTDLVPLYRPGVGVYSRLTHLWVSNTSSGLPVLQVFLDNVRAAEATLAHMATSKRIYRIELKADETFDLIGDGDEWGLQPGYVVKVQSSIADSVTFVLMGEETVSRGRPQ